MHSTITLTPLHDIASLAIHYGKAIIEPAYDVSETVLFDLTLGRGADGLQGEGLGVWAIADKSAMRDIREKRWDLVSAVSGGSVRFIPEDAERDVVNPQSR